MERQQGIRCPRRSTDIGMPIRFSTKGFLVAFTLIAVAFAGLIYPTPMSTHRDLGHSTDPLAHRALAHRFDGESVSTDGF